MSGFTLNASTNNFHNPRVNFFSQTDLASSSSVPPTKNTPDPNKGEQDGFNLGSFFNFFPATWHRMENSIESILNPQPESVETPQTPVVVPPKIKKTEPRITNIADNYTSWNPDLKSDEKTTDTIKFNQLREGKLQLNISSKDYWSQITPLVIRQSTHNPANIIITIENDNVPNKELIIENFFSGEDYKLKSPGSLKVKLGNGEKLEDPFYWMQEAKE